MMRFKTSVKGIFNCTLERAFKTPMLCDVSKVHTGYGIMPKVTHVSDDEGWGQPGSSKKIYVAPSATQKGGWASMDHILERDNNRLWRIRVDNFQSWMLGFKKFEGIWKTIQLEENKIQITYTYFLYSSNPLLYPFNWIFVKTFWNKYMKRVLNNIEKMIETEEPYLYD